MKKLLLITSLAFLFSCSNNDDNNNQGHLTIPTQTSITTWRLVSVTNNEGIEIATDCELQNGQIIVTNDPSISDPYLQQTADITEGKIENTDCRAVTVNDLSWGLFGQQAIATSEDLMYFYDCEIKTENMEHFMSLTLTHWQDLGGNSTYSIEPKTLKYRHESVVYLD